MKKTIEDTGARSILYGVQFVAGTDRESVLDRIAAHVASQPDERKFDVCVAYGSTSLPERLRERSYLARLVAVERGEGGARELRTAMRWDPGVFVVDDYDPDGDVSAAGERVMGRETIWKAAMSGHLVLVGFVADDEDEAIRIALGGVPDDKIDSDTCLVGIEFDGVQLDRDTCRERIRSMGSTITSAPHPDFQPMR